MLSVASSNRSRGGSGSSQDEEPDEFPPTVATDFDTEESAGQIRGLAEQASTSPWLRIGLAAALALAVLVLYAVVRAVKH